MPKESNIKNPNTEAKDNLEQDSQKHERLSRDKVKDCRLCRKLH